MARLSVRSDAQKVGVGTDQVYEPKNAVAQVSADATTANASLVTALADFDLIADTASNGLTALLGASVAYSDTTHQYSGTMGGNATITPTQGAALYALLNTTATAILAVKTALVGVPVNNDVVIDVDLANIASLSRLKRMVRDMLDRFKGVIAE